MDMIIDQIEKIKQINKNENLVIFGKRFILGCC